MSEVVANKKRRYIWRSCSGIARKRTQFDNIPESTVYGPTWGPPGPCRPQTLLSVIPSGYCISIEMVYSDTWHLSCMFKWKIWMAASCDNIFFLFIRYILIHFSVTVNSVYQKFAVILTWSYMVPYPIYYSTLIMPLAWLGCVVTSVV